MDKYILTDTQISDLGQKVKRVLEIRSKAASDLKSETDAIMQDLHKSYIKFSNEKLEEILQLKP